MAYLLNPRRRTTRRRRRTAVRRNDPNPRRIVRRRRRSAGRRRAFAPFVMRSNPLVGVNPARVSFGPQSRQTLSSAMSGAWRSIKRRKSTVRRGIRRYNPNINLTGSLKSAGKLGLGYTAAMIIGSTVTENLFPRLPKIVRIVIRSIVGTGVGYISNMLGYDGDEIVTGSMLYGGSEIARDLLSGRKLPFVLKSGLEEMAAALPAPAGVAGYVFDRNRIGAYVPDRPLPLSATAVASRTASRFARS